MTPDPLQVLVDALEANAASFRRRGKDCCAQEAEQILTRLREAMAAATEASAPAD